MIKKCSKNIKNAALKYLEERFGIPPDLFKGFEFYEGSRRRVFVGPKKIIKDAITTGIHIVRMGKPIKPSTIFFHLFGKYVTKNFVALTKEQAIKYVRGEDLIVETDATDGYVLVRYKNYPLGCGLLSGNKLKNMIPNSKRIELKFI